MEGAKGTTPRTRRSRRSRLSPRTGPRRRSRAGRDARAEGRAREGARERATRSDATRGVAREEATALDDMEASRGLRAPARVSDNGLPTRVTWVAQNSSAREVGRTR